MRTCPDGNKNFFSGQMFAVDLNDFGADKFCRSVYVINIRMLGITCFNFLGVVVNGFGNTVDEFCEINGEFGVVVNIKPSGMFDFNGHISGVSILEGIQPRLRQVPPNLSFSMTATLRPMVAAGEVILAPPPEPMTITSYFFMDAFYQ
jgi:hypothetical protein